MMLSKAEKTISKFQMLKSKDKIVVAVSGGADSVALLYLLNKLKKKWRLELCIAHLNHRLRSEESDSDGDFVKQLARRLKLEINYASVDVADTAKKNKLSIEEAARKERYNFLLQVAEEKSASKIALGHSRDDQSETVLMRFLRGSGMSGLRGIPATREIDKFLIVRPLIEVSRKEILQFLSARDISFRTDSSNLSNVYFRNKIRNQLLPLLEKDFNLNIKELLVNFAENMSEDFDFLEEVGRKAFKALRSSSISKEVKINHKKLLATHTALQKLVVRLAIKELKGDTRRIDYRHWKELEDLIVNRPKNSIVDLPSGVSVVKKDKELVFYIRKTN